MEIRGAHWKCGKCNSTGDLPACTTIENAWKYAAAEHATKNPACDYEWASMHIVFTQDAPYPD